MDVNSFTQLIVAAMSPGMLPLPPYSFVIPQLLIVQRFFFIVTQTTLLIPYLNHLLEQ